MNKKADYYESVATLLDGNKKLTRYIMISVVANIILVFIVLGLAKQKYRNYAVLPNGQPLIMETLQQDTRTIPELTRFAEQYGDLFYAYSYKDFDEETVKAGQSKINNALKLMSPRIRRITEQNFAEMKIPLNMVSQEITLVLEDAKGEVLRDQPPYKVLLTGRYYRLGYEEETMSEIRTVFELMPTQRNMDNILGEYGLEIIGFDTYKGEGTETNEE